jgi:hypothetical protein
VLFFALAGAAFTPGFRDLELPLALVLALLPVLLRLPAFAAGFMSSCPLFSLAQPRALSSSTCPDCIRWRRGRDLSAHVH